MLQPLSFRPDLQLLNANLLPIGRADVRGQCPGRFALVEDPETVKRAAVSRSPSHNQTDPLMTSSLYVHAPTFTGLKIAAPNDASLVSGFL